MDRGPDPHDDTARRYRFGAYVLDLRTRELTNAGEPVELEPGTFAVLTYLVANRDRVVPKEELLDEVWGDRFVSESALTTRIKHARAAIGDDGQSQSAIKTVHRVGYRFVARVTEERRQAESAAAPVRPAIAPSWSTPPAKTVFGRDEDFDSVVVRIGEHRLVTVTGPAGVGKTELCRRLVAEALPGAFAARWFCELADARDPESVANVVLATLGEAQQADADPTESILRVLEDRADLLVFDNCEHLIGPAATLAHRILSRCPAVRIVATSREPLGLREESVYSLGPLGVDDAVRCFVARAGDAGARVDANDSALRDLCRRLDGIPLAIELAAARSRTMAAADMLDMLTDRFRLLRKAEASDSRHASLYAAIAASWDELAEVDRTMLGRLGVFVGNFALDDVRVVALNGADPLDTVDALERLVRRSLVVTSAAHDGRNRFRLLESVRDFALAQVDDLDEVRAAHVRHFTARAEELDEACQTERVDDALTEIREIWVNLRAAVGYAAGAGDVESVRRILRAVGEYADVFGTYEVLEWCEHAALDRELDAEPDTVLAAEALAVRARMLAHQGALDEARELAERAVALHESHATLLAVLWCAYYTGQLDLVVELAPRLVPLSRSERGFDRGYADGFTAIVAAVRQEPAITSTVVTPEDAGRGVLGALDALTAGLRLCTADPGRAAQLLEAVVEASLRNDYRLLLGAAASTLTQITLPARPPREAMQVLQRTLTRYRERGMWNLIVADIVMAARLLADAGDAETAARLLGARLAAGYAVGLSEVLASLLQDELAADLGEAYAPLVDQGRTWRPPRAAEVAIDALAKVAGGAEGHDTR